ncbi:hypothetical protein QUW28_08535 [Enorma phocaeensis]|uniref:Glycosyltransferase RgtA/B/C/D-like domain-containing protein n=2 Tax=Enorma phocaeensis TaxID=1871019 RepID=A0ABT7VAL6_9ACTN|nr:hypothetical protein [Enorma phocaeensis]
MPRAAKRDAHVELCAQSPFPPTMDGCSRDNPALIGAGPLLRFGRLATIGYIVLALTLVVFFSSFMWFRGQRDEVLALGPALLLAAAGVGILLSTLLVPATKGRVQKAPFYPFLILGSGLLLVLQLHVVKGALFYTDWDASVLVAAAVDGIGAHSDYFSQYPNQLFLLNVFRALARLFTDMSYERVYLVLVVGGCACITVATACMAIIARRLAGGRCGAVAFLLAALLVGLSPWMLVPYSDSYGTLCPALALLVYVLATKRTSRMFGVALCSVIGYFIKPTSIFILVAALIAEIVCALEKSGRRDNDVVCRAGQIAASLVAALAGTFLAVAVSFAAVSPFQARLDQTKSLSLSHYLMIGANYESNGRWTEDDYAFSTSYEDPGERSAANIAKWKERISKLGPIGVARLFLRKTLNNYLDGTFWWEGEGLFYREVVGDNQALKDFFNVGYEKNWIAGSSENQTPFFSIAQVVWFVTLLGCIGGIFRRRPTNAECVAYASIFALSMFLVVFECRARYLFLYAPYFTLLAALGWKAMGERMMKAGPRRGVPWHAPASGRHFAHRQDEPCRYAAKRINIKGARTYREARWATRSPHLLDCHPNLLRNARTPRSVPSNQSKWRHCVNCRRSQRPTPTPSIVLGDSRGVGELT